MPSVSGRVVFDINRNANISGAVTGIAGLPVALQNTVTFYTVAAMTGTLGEYTFLNVPAGSYKIIESYALQGAVPTPADFAAASYRVLPPARTPPIGDVPSPPPGATIVDCVTPNTILITVAAADIANQYIFNGSVAYIPLSTGLDPCVTVSPQNVVLSEDGGTFSQFAAGTAANPYPDISPDFSYVVPDPSKYTSTDGEFTIQNTMNNAMSNVIGAWWRISDHTADNETGRMMVVNENNPGSVIFRIVVPINLNSPCLFSAWITNLFRVAGYPGPQFAVRVIDTEGNPICEAPLGFEIPVSTAYPVWQEIGSVVNSLQNTALTIEFFSEGEAAIGNDFAIDDIGLMPVTLPQLALVKSADRAVAVTGDIVTYTVLMSNYCTMPLSNVRFWDYLPRGLEFISGSVNVNGSAAPFANPLVGFDVPDIAGGTTLLVTFEAVAAYLPCPNPAFKRAEIRYLYTPVSGDIADLYTLISNEVPLFVEVPNPVCDLEIRKTANPQTVHPRDTVTYTVTVSNNGPDDADGVLLMDFMPRGIRSPLFSLDGENWQRWCGFYSAGTLASGASFTVFIKGSVSSCARKIITNTACVTSCTAELNPENNVAAAAVEVDFCLRTPITCCGCGRSGFCTCGNSEK